MAGISPFRTLKSFRAKGEIDELHEKKPPFGSRGDPQGPEGQSNITADRRRLTQMKESQKTRIKQKLQEKDEKHYKKSN